jgi:hypothetical protein
MLLKNTLHKAEILDYFAAYSIKYSLNTYCSDQSLSQFGSEYLHEHSNNSHAALNGYFYPDANWIRSDIAPAGPMSGQKAEKAIKEDSRLFGEEKGEESSDPTEEMSEEEAKF